jgi:hypothetical protein
MGNESVTQAVSQNHRKPRELQATPTLKRKRKLDKSEMP